MHKRVRLLIPALVAAIVMPFALAAPASAASTSQWAGWAPLTGAGGAYTTTMTLANKPQLIADVTSDSRAGQVGVISGTSTWLAQGTPVGAKYGSSINQPYLNLRPKADTPTAPSTTTYSFRTPTPTSGWTFVLGDIDADQVQIRAVGPNGVALTSAQLGFRGGFNYCAPGVTGKPSCTGSATDVPSWNPTTAVLLGNAAASDTSGASAWFEPSAAIASLTFVYAQRSGFPVYQTWFASLARDITGTVTDQTTGPLNGATVTLTDRTGAVVGTATTAGGGLYSFPGFLATDGYTVSVTPPVGKIAVGAASKPADLTATDAVVDFAVRDIVPVGVSGTVRDTDGHPIAGAVITVDGQSATSGPDGTYRFESVAVGTYTPTITPPAGYTSVAPLPSFTVSTGSESPIVDVDFVVAANPTISGTVTAGGTGVAGVTVTAVGPGGTETTVTATDGTYSFPRVPSGGYTVTVTPPAGSTVDGPASQSVTVATNDVTDVDFALAKAGSIAGAVDDGTTPVPGATVTVSGPGGSTVLTTDASGAYALGSLPSGTYTITLTVPAGYTAGSPLTKTVTVTAAGEAFVDQDFAVTAVVVPPTTPPTTPAQPGTTGTSVGELADTGSSVNAWPAIIAGIVVLLGAAAVIIAAVRRRRSQ
ncbi:MSCRAMM family protein [Leifsonia poae]|uniref:MSCRAMM family protein n=1 Tax=Leifsonia poae TaxID=110933 RepID=UPI001CC0D688|nr:carboxypeptidase regulatory-like domain-containing protein [Leifsonia poae]